MATVLNTIVSSSKRKRSRSIGKSTTPSSKRQFVEQPADDLTATIDTPVTTQRPPVESSRRATRLSLRNHLVSTPAPVYGANKYDVPTSPEQSHTRVSPAKKPFKRPNKKILKNAGPEPSPLRGVEWTSGDMAPKGVVLTSFNSPAKRIRKPNPLRGFQIPARRTPRKSLVINVASRRSPTPTAEVPLKPTEAADGVVGSEPAAISPANQQIPDLGNKAADIVEGDVELENQIHTRPQSTGEESSAPPYIDESADIQVENVLQDNQAVRPMKFPTNLPPVSDAAEKNAPRSRSVKAAVPALDEKDNEDNDDDKDHLETDVDRAARLAREFMLNISEISHALSIFQHLSSVAGVTQTIKIYDSASKRDDQSLNTERSNKVWTCITKLNSMYRKRSSPNNDEALKRLNRLLEASNAFVLFKRSEDSQSRNDRCALDVARYCIPRSIDLLRRVLLHQDSKQPTRTGLWHVTIVLRAIYNLVDAVLERSRKPALGDIAGKLYTTVRPGVRSMLEKVQARQRYLVFQHESQQSAVVLAQRQQEAVARMERLETERRQGRDVHRNNYEGPTGSSTRAETVHDVDDLECDPIEPRRPPPLARRITTDIPAPDPTTTWSREESLVLLDGLQTYTGPDRFVRLSEDRRLGAKTSEQIHKEARRIREICGNFIATIAAEGGPALNWLESIV